MVAQNTATKVTRLSMLRVLSLGAGVQSTTMALMAAAGELTPMPDAALFADTGWEPAGVYAHLARLKGQLPFPVHVVSAGNIRDAILAGKNRVGGHFASVPWHLGNGGLGRRQCTREYKLEPLQRKQREMLGYAPRQRIPRNSVEIWIGISLDEVGRMKPAREAWQTNRWPLIERSMNRWDCLQWLRRHGHAEPVKSACVGCPYRDNASWRSLTEAEFADAVAVDRQLRDRGSRSMRHQMFMHRSLKPLDQVDMRTDAELGQLDLFQNECEGMCGV